MKEVTCNTFSPGYIPFDFIFDIPETETTKGKDNVKVTIYLPPYNEYGKEPDTQYMEEVAGLLAEADWHSIPIDEYSKELENGDFVSIPDENWEYHIDYRGLKRTTFLEKIDSMIHDFEDDIIDFSKTREDLTLLKEFVPREILLNTKTTTQVLNLLKETYHPKNGYNLSDFTQWNKETSLYKIAVAHFDSFGRYIIDSPIACRKENGVFCHHLKPSFWYTVREMLSLGKIQKFTSVNGIFIETHGIKLPLEDFRGNVETLRVAYFDSEEYFNPLLMGYVTSIKGNFTLTDSYSISTDSKQVLFSLDSEDKNVVHRIYEYDHSLLAVVKKDFS